MCFNTLDKLPNEFSWWCKFVDGGPIETDLLHNSCREINVCPSQMPRRHPISVTKFTTKWRCCFYPQKWNTSKGPLFWFHHLPLAHICDSQLVMAGQFCTEHRHFFKQLPEPMNHRNNVQWNSIQETKFFIHENEIENAICEMTAILSRGRWVYFYEVYDHIFSYVSAVYNDDSSDRDILLGYRYIHDFNIQGLLIFT